ncbi:MAG: M20 family metallopeptidase [Coleofasciculus sp. B1-GNL1-01]|uniref:M20 family metallopeptidase n=1 Tax=Coleofasciculus sp. B1-GNL1-01 TaxID=3068484 RepID=UPI0032F778AA
MNNQLHRRHKIHRLQPNLVQWRRHIHQHPELAFQEHQTANFISQKLTEWGITHQTGIAKTGIIAQIEGTKPSVNPQNLAIRADMDALPILEDNSVPYQSQHHGIMHACGHDGHTAILLGTAYYLAHHREYFAGTIKLIFQPAEEGLGGAKAMIEAGVLENVAAIIGLHLWNNLPLGTVGVRHGALMAASEAFFCQILGKGGHGGMPHQTVDAVVVGAHIIQALQTIISRNIDPLDAAVITVGELHAGTKQNVVAATAKLSGTVRYFNPALTQFIPQRIEQIIAGICQIHGADYKLDYQQISPPLVNDETITNLLHSVAESVVKTPTDVTSDCQTLASEDMAYFLQKIPGCFFFVGSANSKKGLNAPHHHPQFDFDETALAIGVEVFVRFVEAFCG